MYTELAEQALMKPPTLVDVEERKIGSVIDKMKDAVNEGQLTRYAGYIEKALEEMNTGDEKENYINTLDVAAALLKMTFAQNNAQECPDLDNEDDDMGAEGGMVRFFINIGSIQKIQPRHIVESIASKTSLPGKLIGAIDI
ncbi:MAG: helicase, partial [Clostridiales bacterium]|nr:helicase [Clostridiales bacterium]